jgi:hypothetical protein
MLAGVDPDLHDDAREPDTDEAFDRRVGDVLESEAEMLRDSADALMDRGSISIARPGVLVRARLRLPRSWRAGVLEVCADYTGGRSSHGVIPLGLRPRDPASLLGEITLQLAVALADADD